MSLASQAWISIVALFVAMALVLFVPAGTLNWWQAWVYLAVFFGTTIVITIDLLKRDPALLQRRMRGGPTAEKEPTQRVIMLLASLAFIALLVVPALDRRFGWSQVPLVVIIIGDVLALTGFLFIGRVYRENTYTRSTIEVSEGQTVISTGPYAIVRHPMYASAMLYLIGTPLALGSWRGLIPLVVMVPVLVWRLLDEERVLVLGLEGYAEYRLRVRYRLVPFVW